MLVRAISCLFVHFDFHEAETFYNFCQWLRHLLVWALYIGVCLRRPIQTHIFREQKSFSRMICTFLSKYVSLNVNLYFLEVIWDDVIAIYFSCLRNSDFFLFFSLYTWTYSKPYKLVSVKIGNNQIMSTFGWMWWSNGGWSEPLTTWK